jgi:hypothetical protein
MRDQWYGDKRDVVKWAVLLQLAKTHRLKKILQVAFYRPSDRVPPLTAGWRQVPIPQAVIDHFRNLERICGLGEATGLEIEVYGEPFPAAEPARNVVDAREQYVNQVAARLRVRRRASLIAFLDPDTGMAPQQPDAKHVTADEVRRIYAALQTGDLLVLYQHARRTTDWLIDTRRAFSDAVRRSEKSVKTLRCPEIAHDVAFFAVRKGR